MPFRHDVERGSAAGAVALVVALFAAGCMTYRGPRGVEAMIERKAEVELKRELGFKLGPLSTKIAVSILRHEDDDTDFRDLSGIGVAVFEVTGHAGAHAQPITAADLGLTGWRPIVENRSDGEQVLLLAKPADGETREMMFLSIERDEVVVARLKGHLDRLIAKTLAAAEHDGARGARAAIGAGTR
jgi:hypothetical protein